MSRAKIINEQFQLETDFINDATLKGSLKDESWDINKKNWYGRFQ